MITDRHHFYFFGNKEISSLHVALGLISFGEGLISIFVPIYFWELGMPLWRILFFFFLNSVYFICLSFALLPLLRRLSNKIMMFISIPLAVFYFSGLGLLPEFSFLFFVLPLFLSASALLFNVGYHGNFSSVSDDDHIGREVGMRYTVSSLMQLAAPFLGGMLIAFFGFVNAFLVGTTIMVFSTLPLFLFPKRKTASQIGIKSVVRFLAHKKLYPFTLSGIGYATEKEVLRIVWPLFIFFSIGSIEQFGAVISFGLVIGALIALFSGFLSDEGRRRKVLAWSTVLYSFIWVLRPFFAGPLAVMGSHLAGRFADASLMVAWSSQYYKIARAVGDASSFILSREVLYHLSRIVFFPVLMVFAFLFSQGAFFMASFFAAGGLSLLLLFANKLSTRSVRV
ncbi:MAG: hypothetical protein Q8O83_03370 [bacterium]|nr:hypothetical protein [bacterium]